MRNAVITLFKSIKPIRHGPGAFSTLGFFVFQNYFLATKKVCILSTLFLTTLVHATLSQTIVEAHGQLRVEGSKIKDECGRNTQLRGMSFFWHQWDNSAAYWNEDVVEWLRDDWNVQIVRGAVGIHESGWFDDPELAELTAERLIEAAVEKGVYVIVDWHSHDIHTEEARGFFTRIAKKYGHHPNVIYELFNEPDGNSWTDLDETWSDIKTYAMDLIAAIRIHDPDNIIIVGTPFYSQFVDHAADDPITVDKNGDPAKNIAYTLHFYAGAHKEEIRNRAIYALNKGIALWVTECGRTGANFGPDNTIDTDSWDTWEAWMDTNDISWSKWSLGIKNEVSSSLRPSASIAGGWDFNNDLRSEGQWNREHLRVKNTIPEVCDPDNPVLGTGAELKDPIKIFPNPLINGPLTIQWKQDVNRKININIYDLRGAEIHKTQFQHNGTTLISRETFANPGIYMLKLTNRSDSRVFKIAVN